MLLQIIHADNDVLLHQKLSDIAASNSHHLTKILGSDSLGNTNWDMATNIWKLFHAQYIPDECEIGPFEFHKRKKMWDIGDILDFGAFLLHC